MNTRQAVFQSYMVPFKLVEGLGLECGYEKSFKLVAGNLLRNRYLMGIDRQYLDDNKLSLILERMQMPEKFIQSFHDRLDNANLVLLGFEEGAAKCTYKIYLEYWDRIRASLAGKSPPFDPITMFVGFKWNAFDVSESVMTDYRYYPGLSLDQILARIDNLGASFEDRTTLDVAAEIIQHASERIDPDRFIYLEASEAGNPRRSFDINLYAAELRLASVHSFTSRLARLFAVAEQEIDRLFEDISDAMLGHLSGGIDRKGANFFSIYYEP